MDRDSVKWAGPMPAVVTPFDAAGRVDEAGFFANVDVGAPGAPMDPSAATFARNLR